MKVRATVIHTLKDRTEPLTGRAVADAAGLPYKVAIDALGWLHDNGAVVRFGRKYSAVWALAGTPAAAPRDPLAPVEAVWRAAPDPHPHGGEAEATPRPS